MAAKGDPECSQSLEESQDQPHCQQQIQLQDSPGEVTSFAAANEVKQACVQAIENEDSPEAAPMPDPLSLPRNKVSGVYVKNSSPFSWEDGVIVKQYVDSASLDEIPLLETAEELFGPSFNAVFFPAEDPASPVSEALTLTSPTFPAHNQPAPLSVIPGSSSEESVPASDMEKMFALLRTRMVVEPQDSSEQGLETQIRENWTAFSKLEDDLERIVIAREKVEQELLLTKQQHEAEIKQKKAEISQLKDQIEISEQHISSLEKSKQDERVKYEAEIQHMQEELEEKRKELEKRLELFELTKNILIHKEMILRMKADEQKLKHLLAEANLTISEREKEKKDKHDL